MNENPVLFPGIDSSNRQARASRGYETRTTEAGLAAHHMAVKA